MGKSQDQTPVKLAIALLTGLFIMVFLPGTASATGGSLTVSPGWPHFSIREVNPGGGTTAYFWPTPYVGSPGRGGKPATALTGESFSVEVDKYTTIGAISTNVTGCVPKVTGTAPDSSGGTIERFELTQVLPTSQFVLSIALTSSAAAPPGPHPVTLAPTSITVKDNGTMESGAVHSPVEEDYYVESLATNVTGDPFVIIPGKAELSTKSGPVVSMYHAYATGGSGSYSWTWSEGPGIQLDSQYGSYTNHMEPIGVYGSAAGPSEMTCIAHDNVSGIDSPLPGKCTVTVVPEFTYQFPGPAFGVVDTAAQSGWPGQNLNAAPLRISVTCHSGTPQTTSLELGTGVILSSTDLADLAAAMHVNSSLEISQGGGIETLGPISVPVNGWWCAGPTMMATPGTFEHNTPSARGQQQDAMELAPHSDTALLNTPAGGGFTAVSGYPGFYKVPPVP